HFDCVMTEPIVQAASRLAECCTLLAIGYHLKQSGILRISDGETAIKVATTLTLPSVIVQALGNGGPLGFGAASLLGVAAVCTGTQLAATWLHVMQRSVRERSLLAGSCTGLSLQLLGYPIVECFLGGGAARTGAGAGAALQTVTLIDLLNHLSVWVGSYMLFAGAGPAFPESFKHEDGGDYRGQWRGMRKEGLGMYTYPSGARYEGEWRNNVKEGRGVYYFPKGGVYEGEWSGGTMNGLGVRTFSTGQVKAGRWRDGQLEMPLDLWQVALAADGATTAADAARSVEVGGGGFLDAAHMLVAQPTLWALLGGVALNLARVPLPTSLDVITGVLAQANTPLTLLAAGITAPALAAPPGLRQLLPDIARLLGARLLVPLFVGLNLVALLVAGSTDGVFHVASASLMPLAAALIALLAPVPPQALANARRFRLNESTAATFTAASYLICVPLMLLAGVAACATGLALPPPGVAAAGTIVDARPLGVFTFTALVAVSAAISYVTRTFSQTSSSSQVSEDRRIRMVYAGPMETTTQSLSAQSAVAPAAGEASSPPATTGAGRSGVPGAGAMEPPSTSAGSGSGSGSTGNGSEGGGGGGGSANAGPRLPPAAATATGMGLVASCWVIWGLCAVQRRLILGGGFLCGSRGVGGRWAPLVTRTHRSHVGRGTGTSPGRRSLTAASRQVCCRLAGIKRFGQLAPLPRTAVVR
ncbi:hypothetical protein VaNZ11_010095, partial [Volvox africanus]